MNIAHPITTAMVRHGHPLISPEPAHLVSVGIFGTTRFVVPDACDIIHSAAIAGGIDASMLLSPSRTEPAQRARHTTMVLLRRWLCLSYPQIQRRLNYKGHGACVHGVRRALVSAYGLGGAERWAARIIEATAADLFGDAAEAAIHLAIPHRHTIATGAMLS